MPDYIFKDQSSAEEMDVTITHNSMTVGISCACDEYKLHTQQNKVLIFKEEALRLANLIIEEFTRPESPITNALPIVRLDTGEYVAVDLSVIRKEDIEEPPAD